MGGVRKRGIKKGERRTGWKKRGKRMRRGKGGKSEEMEDNKGGKEEYEQYPSDGDLSSARDRKEQRKYLNAKYSDFKSDSESRRKMEKRAR